MGTPAQTAEKKRKAIVYIDGFNLYFAMREKGWRSFMWLDLIKLSRRLLCEDQELVHVRYFTSRIKNDVEKQKRQNKYLDALGTLDPTILKIHYGDYQSNNFPCTSCGYEIKDQQEKQTDVNIATYMLLDSFTTDKVDDIILVTADSDQVPAVKACRILKKNVLVVLPPGRGDYFELKKFSDSHLELTAKKFKDSRLPESIPVGAYTIECPTKWRER
ncbi:MAG TPA: NYN domain-containing protein [Candidatus Koribacter sp.]|jgi:uncharacterized LabA/DUF88 family protein